MKSGHKMHHHRKHKASGGKMDSPAEGSKEWEADEKTKAVKYTGGRPEEEAEERKRGGRAKRNHGGMVKHIGKVHGHKPSVNAGRKPRKSGGRAGSNFSPLSSAHKGSPPRDHKAVEVD